MSGEELLQRYSDVVKDRERIEELIEYYREKMTSPGTTQFDWIPAGRGNASDPTGEAVIKLSELECKRYDLIGKKCLIGAVIVWVTMSMTDAHYMRFIYLRYVKGMIFREISEDMGLTMSYLHRIKSKAFADFDRACAEVSGSRSLEDWKEWNYKYKG